MNITIFGQDYTEQIETIEFATPRYAHKVPRKDREVRLLGACDFSIHLVTERKNRFLLEALSVNEVTLTAEDGTSLTNTVQFLEKWEEDGKHHAFGILKYGAKVGEWKTKAPLVVL